ncbi:MAG: CoA pyrophosphatase, partial [Alicyclobacillus sp.]|nr:CoA pyrophosphatase [Alicyclobacillus sp.]
GFIGEPPLLQAAVLIPLVERTPGCIEVLFEQRAFTLRRQAGEICFPGGRFEEAQDADVSAAAVRETCEELRVAPSDIECLGPLDVLVASPQTLIFPVVGRLRYSGPLQPNPAEVHEVFTVPLSELLALQPRAYTLRFVPQPPPDLPVSLLPGGTMYRWREITRTVYFYEAGQRVIWGMTARILKHFLELVRSVV